MPSFGGGPSTYSQGGNPAPYVPTGQSAADTSYQSLLQGIINPSLNFLNQGQQFPAQQYYPAAQTIAGWQTNNPYFPEAQQAAGLGAQYGQAAGQQAYNTGMNTFPYLAGQVTGLTPDLQNAVRGILGQAPGIADQTRGPIAALQSSGNQILGTAFDPQQNLYNSQLQQVTDQQNAALAQQGLSGSPYAAGLLDDATQNFMTNWQNQQLGRQATGIQSANQAFAGAGNLNSAAINQLVAALSGGAQGAQTVGNLQTAGGNLLTQGANLANQGAQGIYQAGQLPYQQLNQYSQGGMNAINSLVGLGNQQYDPIYQALNALSNYMGLGRQASLAAVGSGATGFNQGLQSAAGLAGGLGGAANLAFGNTLGMGGGLLGALGLNPFINSAIAPFSAFAPGAAFGADTLAAGGGLAGAIGGGADLLPLAIL